MSPASTIGYKQKAGDALSRTLDNNLPSDLVNVLPDPFDFDSELALIQDEELCNKRTKALVDNLKGSQLDLMSRCLTPPMAFMDSSLTQASVPDNPECTTISAVLEQASQVLDGAESPSHCYEGITHNAVIEQARELSPSVHNKVSGELSNAENTWDTLQTIVVDDDEKSVNVSSSHPVVVLPKLVKIVQVIPQNVLEQQVAAGPQPQGPHTNYDKAIADLKNSGTEMPPWCRSDSWHSA